MRRVLFGMLCVLLLAGCTSNIETSNTPANAVGKIFVHFIEVGQGDSIFIESPDGKTMLVDGGMKGAGEEIVAAREGQSYLKWTGRQIWLNDGDSAQLLNARGKLSELD